MEIPKFLIERYQFWKKNTFKNYKDIYQQASKTPQKPIAMIITCCDSRILENTIFGGSVGDYFIHRNIANIVPSKNDKDQNIQTLSAIEYALKVLKIQNLIILGHSNCGGVEYSYKTLLDKKNTNDFEYIRCKNISPSPKISFLLDPEALVKNDGNIWGIFHSHPGEDNPIPSKEDKVSAAFNEYKFLVGFNNKFYIYWLNDKIDALIFDEFKFFLDFFFSRFFSSKILGSIYLIIFISGLFHQRKVFFKFDSFYFYLITIIFISYFIPLIYAEVKVPILTDRYIIFIVVPILLLISYGIMSVTNQKFRYSISSTYK